MKTPKSVSIVSECADAPEVITQRLRCKTGRTGFSLTLSLVSSCPSPFSNLFVITYRITDAGTGLVGKNYFDRVTNP